LFQKKKHWYEEQIVAQKKYFALGKINCNSGPHNESLSTAQVYTKQHDALLHFKHSTNQDNLVNEV